MNNVSLDQKEITVEYSPGSIWKNVDDICYMLATLNESEFVAISLDDGNRWLDPKATGVKAVNGLRFVAKKADIKITI